MAKAGSKTKVGKRTVKVRSGKPFARGEQVPTINTGSKRIVRSSGGGSHSLPTKDPKTGSYTTRGSTARLKRSTAVFAGALKRLAEK